MNFIKMHALGNDYVLIDCRERILFDRGKLAEKVCKRKFSIGADGVLFVEKSKRANGKMRIFNSDGSEAEMCGNGIRCVAKYLYDEGRCLDKTVKIETLSGLKKVEITAYENKAVSCSVNIGRVEEIGRLDGGLCVRTGNPHFVKQVSNVNDYDLKSLYDRISHSDIFENSANVEIFEVADKNKIYMRVYERGVGETLSCGTGSCATVYFAEKLGLVERKKVTVVQRGGSVEVSLKGSSAVLGGEVYETFRGNISD